MAAVALVLGLADGRLAAAQVQPPQQRINLALARAREVGIPIALLESKIAEGKAKGVSLERIAAVIERRQATLLRVSSLLKGRPDVQAADLAVAADAMESGVSDAVLNAVLDAAPRERRVVAIAALTQLVEQGQAPAAALERVRDALKRGPEVLANLAAQGRGRGAEIGRGGSQAGETSAGRSRGSAGGPPAAVPPPGESSQPSRPGRGPQGRGGGQP